MERIQAWLSEIIKPNESFDKPKPKTYHMLLDDFDFSNTQKSQGATGSVKVEHKEKAGLFYQLKKSITHAKWSRRFKVSHADRENMGEFIAATVSSSVLPNKVPHIALVSDEDELHIASEYVQEPHDSLGTKDKLVDVNMPNKKGLADAIALSALSGDHDINPENMIIVDNQIVRIDFGHAFNDLIRFRFPGGRKVSDNRIIDYFNREHVNGFFSKSYDSKLWRHYTDGLIPSSEMVQALKKISARYSFIGPGLKTARDELKKIQNPKMQQQVTKALLSINESIHGLEINKNLSYHEFLDAFFINLIGFYQTGAEDMRKTAKIMALQLRIDQAIQKNDAVALRTLRRKYGKLNIEWIKTNAKQTAFQGSFDDYVKSRQYLTAVPKDLGGGPDAQLRSGKHDEALKAYRDRDDMIRLLGLKNMTLEEKLFLEQLVAGDSSCRNFLEAIRQGKLLDAQLLEPVKKKLFQLELRPEHQRILPTLGDILTNNTQFHTDSLMDVPGFDWGNTKLEGTLSRHLANRLKFAASNPNEVYWDERQESGLMDRHAGWKVESMPTQNEAKPLKLTRTLGLRQGNREEMSEVELELPNMSYEVAKQVMLALQYKAKHTKEIFDPSLQGVKEACEKFLENCDTKIQRMQRRLLQENLS